MNIFPDASLIWELILVFIGGTILLRVAGKKSISEMSVPEAVIMIAIGTLLIQPIKPKNEWAAVIGGVILVGCMLLASYVQIWFPASRKWLAGKPTVLIQDGKADLRQLKKVRLTVDQLEMRLRQLQVGNIADVKTGILEPSGVLSIMKTEPKSNATKEDLQMVLNEIYRLRGEISALKSGYEATDAEPGEIVHPSSDPLFRDESGNSPVH